MTKSFKLIEDIGSGRGELQPFEQPVSLTRAERIDDRTQRCKLFLMVRKPSANQLGLLKASVTFNIF
jgi:hypothetical protein